MTLDKFAAFANAAAAVGASLQAAGVLNGLGPTAMAIALAIIAALNAASHALAPSPAK